MAWNDLKAAVAAVVRTNGTQAITGALLQSTLSSIIDQVGANATFKGVATPSTVPGAQDGPVFYIASTQGTYANFGGFVLDGGFAVLSNVTGSWTGTKFLKTEMDAKADHGYGEGETVKTVKDLDDELVQFRSDLNELEQEQIQGGVYDVSSHNDDVVFESLLALLGSANLSTLIPTSVRRGGMSIRFIHGSVPNSDNKYVQYRLMAAEWSTTVADWQGVDDIPTAGSKNLVESGGVADAIDIIIDNTFNANTIIFTSDDVSEGDEIYYKAKVLSTAFSFILYDASNNVLLTVGKIDQTSGAIFDGYITIPQGFSYAKTRYQTFEMFVGGCTYKNAINKRVNDNHTVSKKNKNDITMLDEFTGNVKMELGNISMTTRGWTYLDSNKKARTLKDCSYKLQKGTVISISDHANNSLYIGYKKNGVYTVIGLIPSGSYICPVTAEYVIIITDDTQAAHDSVDYFTNLLSITYYNDEIKDKIDAVINSQNNLSEKVYVTTNVIGLIYSNSSAPAGTVAFTADDVTIGEKILYKIKVLEHQFKIGLYDANDTLLSSISKNSVGAGYTESGYITIPSGFSYAKTEWANFKVEFGHENINDALLQKINSVDLKTDDIFNTKVNQVIKTSISLDDFEIGNLNISTGGWSYDSSSSSRVRSKQGTIFHLYPGTVISLTRGVQYVSGNVVEYKFYLGWQISTGEYKTKGAWVKTFTVEEEGDYVLVIKRDGNPTLTEASEFAKYISIRNDIGNLNYDALVSAPGRKTFFKAANHRGYQDIAPENTLPAFALSKKVGFTIVETDVRLTSDNVLVLLHDTTINRTARNADGTDVSSTVNIADITYQQALEYDFGVWKDEKYKGTKISTLEELLSLCRNLGLEIYLELKLSTQEYVNDIVSLVKGYGMLNNVVFIGGSTAALGYVKSVSPYSRLGIVAESISTSIVETAQALKSDNNEVFIDCQYYKGTDARNAGFAAAKVAGIPVEQWVVNLQMNLWDLDPYISGVTTNSLNADGMVMQNIMQDYFGIQ